MTDQQEHNQKLIDFQVIFGSQTHSTKSSSQCSPQFMISNLLAINKKKREQKERQRLQTERINKQKAQKEKQMKKIALTFEQNHGFSTKKNMDKKGPNKEKYIEDQTKGQNTSSNKHQNGKRIYKPQIVDYFSSSKNKQKQKGIQQKDSRKKPNSSNNKSKYVQVLVIQKRVRMVQTKDPSKLDKTSLKNIIITTTDIQDKTKKQKIIQKIKQKEAVKEKEYIKSREVHSNYPQKDVNKKVQQKKGVQQQKNDEQISSKPYQQGKSKMKRLKKMRKQSSSSSQQSQLNWRKMLRQTTRYNPSDKKFRELDRMQIQQSSAHQLFKQQFISRRQAIRDQEQDLKREKIQHMRSKMKLSPKTNQKNQRKQSQGMPQIQKSRKQMQQRKKKQRQRQNGQKVRRQNQYKRKAIQVKRRQEQEEKQKQKQKLLAQKQKQKKYENIKSMSLADCPKIIPIKRKQSKKDKYSDCQRYSVSNKVGNLNQNLKKKDRNSSHKKIRQYGEQYPADQQSFQLLVVKPDPTYVNPEPAQFHFQVKLEEGDYCRKKKVQNKNNILQKKMSQDNSQSKNSQQKIQVKMEEIADEDLNNDNTIEQNNSGENSLKLKIQNISPSKQAQIDKDLAYSNLEATLINNLQQKQNNQKQIIQINYHTSFKFKKCIQQFNANQKDQLSQHQNLNNFQSDILLKLEFNQMFSELQTQTQRSRAKQQPSLNQQVQLKVEQDQVEQGEVVGEYFHNCTKLQDQQTSKQNLNSKQINKSSIITDVKTEALYQQKYKKVQYPTNSSENVRKVFHQEQIDY